MASHSTTNLRAKYLFCTHLSRRYEYQGAAQFIPNSVHTVLERFGDKPGDLHDIAVQDWWLKENPFVKPESKGQTDLFA